MKLSGIFSILLCGTVGHSIGSTLKPLDEMSVEYSVLQRKITFLEERLSVLEARDSSDRAQTVKDLSTRLDDIEQKTSEQKEEILNTLSNVEKTFKLSFYEMSERLANDKNTFLMMNNHLLTEVHDLQKNSHQTSEKMTNLENDLKSAYETCKKKTNFLQVKLNETSEQVQRCLASQKVTEEALQMNISSSFEKLRVHINESLRTGLEDVTAKMGIMENSLLTLRKECANISNVSNLRNLTMTKFQSVKDTHTEDIKALKDILTNHSIQIDNLRTELISFEPVCYPPCENGGHCMKNNVCNCTLLFNGNRCENDEPQCGLDYDSVGNNGSRNASGRNSRYLVSPWMAALYDSENYFCDGSIIHRRFVLMAARCMYYSTDSGYQRRLNEKVKVKLGLTDLKDETNLQEYNVRLQHIHPEYKGVVSGDYDIGLLELEKPIEYNYYIRPICLPPKEIPEDNRFYHVQSNARGINLRKYINAISTSQNIPADSLRNMDFIIQHHDTCRAKLGGTGWDKYYPSPDRMFCAVPRENGYGACYDLQRGTPLMQSHSTNDGTRIWTQVGIRSSGCIANAKDLFATQIQNLMPWVDATIKTSAKN